MDNRLKGLLATVIVASVAVAILFSPVLRSPGKYSFSGTGAGLSPYYSSIYHFQFGEKPFRFEGMNYPYGDMTYFTNSQALVVFFATWVSNNGMWNINIVSLINIMILVSIVLAALFLYLIMSELGTPWWYASAVSVGISFLSPQLASMTGDLSLSWLVWLPLMVFLIIRFDKTRNLLYSFAMGIVTFLAGLAHPYFLVFFGILLAGYWFFRFFRYRKASTYWYRDIVHFFIQYFLPLLILEFIIMANSDVTDRSVWTGHFLRSKPQSFGLESLLPPNVLTSGWWSVVFTFGLPAVVGFFGGTMLLVRRLVKKESVFRVSRSTALSVLFWVSVLAVPLSFLFSIKPVMVWFSGYFGFIYHMPGPGYALWMLFYLLNLVFFESLYHKFLVPGTVGWMKILAIFSVTVLTADGVVHSSRFCSQVQNPLPELNEQEAHCLSLIVPGDYQAIVPIPFFYSGSGNLGFEQRPEAVEYTLLASLYTGLPTTGALLKNASVSQAFINYGIFTEQLERPELPDYLPDERPLLLLVMKNHRLSLPEQILLSNAKTLAETDGFSIHSLSVTALRGLNMVYRDIVVSRYQASQLFDRGRYLVNEEDAFVRSYAFNDQPSGKSFSGGGALEFPSRQWKTACTDTLENIASGTELFVSFWFNDYRRDGYFNTELKITLSSNLDGQTKVFSAPIKRHIKAFYGDWALVEFPFVTQSKNDKLTVSVCNMQLPGTTFTLDELLIREKGTDVFRVEGRHLEMNGRRVLLR